MNGSTWTQVGVDIDGEAAGDYSGRSVSLSSDGSRVAIGSTGNDGSFTSAGHVRVYTIGEYQYAWNVDGNGTPSDGSYSATVSGTDTAGNAYVAGTQSITFTIDTTAPSVSLTNNDGDNVINNSSSVVTITATFNEAMTDSPTITIGNGVSNVTMTKSSTTIWTYYLNMASWGGSGASAVVTVTGSDIAGNAYSGTDSITFTIDNTAPTVNITTSDSDNIVKSADSNITVTATFNEAMATAPRITIGSAVNNTALTATSSTTWTYTWNISSVTEGSYTVTVTGTDLAGNAYAGSDKITITLDSTAPTVTLTNSDSDNLIAASDTVTITTAFDEAMTSTPTISISGTSISNQVMTKIIGGSGLGSHTLLGADIDGEAVSDYSGNSVSFSSDGSRVAIGAYFNDGVSGSNSGHVRIYNYTPSGTASWTQLGADIDGEAAGDQSGFSVSLSSDGSRVAIGAYANDGVSGSNSGHVRIYNYTPSGTASWTQLGADIDGEAAGDYSGNSVSLSSDGSRVAIGAHDNDGNGTNSGHVRIYNYTPSGTASWTQLGADIDGEAVSDGSGFSVSLSSDGSRVAIGAYANDGVSGSNSGHVRIYDYTPSGVTSWTQVSGDIDGEASDDQSGWSVSLSSDGSRVAIGATLNDGNGTYSGHVRIYNYTPSGTASWTQLGADIDGEAAGDESGRSVSLSSDGSRVAIGAYFNDGVSGSNSGHVRIYNYTPSGTASWTQLGADIDGEAAGDESGRSVSLSSDGSRVAIGAYNNDGVSGSASGHVRVYSLSSGETYQYVWEVVKEGALSEGSYSATVAASDKAGNAYVAGTQSITFTLDTTAPTVTLTNTDNNNKVNTSSVVTFTAVFSEALQGSPTITIPGIVTDTPLTLVSGTTWKYTWDTSSGTLAEGSHTVSITGQDPAGNSATVTSTFVVDTTVPTLSGLTNNDGNNTLNGTDTVTITATFNESMNNSPTITIGNGVTDVAMTATSSTVWTYFLDMSSWSGSGSSAVVTVTGFDGAENSYAGTDSFTFNLDSTAPTVTLTNSDSDNLIAASNTVTITATFSEALTTTPTISISGGLLSNVVMGGGSSGSVSFTATNISTSANGASDVFAADLDGDGDMDILSSDYSDSKISWYENDGNANPTWAHAYVYSNSMRSISVFAADMDGDGDMDILSAGANMNKISWYENDGNANPTWAWDSVTAPNSPSNPVSVFAADMDGDGDMDIVSASRNDSDIDWYDNNGASNPTWTARSVFDDGFDQVSVFVADMDGDGDMDVVAAQNGDDTISWHENSSTNYVLKFPPSADTDIVSQGPDSSADGARSVYAADMDGDGDMDILSASSIDDTIAWYENDGNANPTFAPANISTNVDGAYDVFAVDIDGDGDMDIVSASADDDTIAWYENDGNANPTWTKAVIDTNAVNANSVFAADMDGDGDMDILSASSGDSTIAWYENGVSFSYSWDVDGNGTPSDGTYYATFTATDKAGNAYVAGTQSITFTIDSTAPTVTLTDTDSDNFVNVSQVVTITAGFSEAMTATPTISITGIVTNVIMTPVSGTNSYTFTWDTSSGTLSDGIYSATVSGTDIIGNSYVVGTQSITFTLDTSSPTVTITTSDSDNTIKPGDNITVTVTFNEAMASGPRITIGSAVSNVALTATNSTTFTYSWSTSGVSAGSYTVTVTGTDLAGNAYAGSDKTTIRLDSTAPTVTLTNSDSNNLIAASDTVTITAIFSEALTTTPTISISGGLLSNVAMLGGTASFTAADIATSADAAISVYAADMDGDGDMDIVSASLLDDTIAWYENNGAADPTWTAADIATSADGAQSVFAADMDGDGDMDILSASSTDDTIAWYENNGAADPTWTAANIATSADGAQSVFAADMDGDGDMDIVSASSTDDTIAWYENNGAADPTWAASDIATSADGALSVFAADMDGDGDMDIVSASHTDDTIAWYENNGAADPTWAAADIATSADAASSVFAADMDGDGDMDILSASSNDDTIAWYENNGAADPTWAAADIATSADAASSVFAADMDGDGDMDIVSASASDDTIAWYENNGAADPSWAAADIATSADGAQSVFAADMDGDGDMDILSASLNDDTIAWYENGVGYSYSWDVDGGGTPSNGTYYATVATTDKAGNAYVAGTQSITFTLDTTAPTVTLTNTDNNNKVNTSSVVTFTAVFSEALQGSPTITIPGIVTDTPLTLVSGTTWKYTWDTSSGTLAEGSHTVSITGQDPAGNSATVTSTFVVDTTVPTLSGLTNNDGNNTLNGTDTVTITATFNEPMNNSPTITIGNGVTDVAMTATSSTVWTYFLDMSSWSGSGSSAVVTVTGFDGAENSYAGTDSFTFNLDSSTPSVTAITAISSSGTYVDDDANPSNSDTINIKVTFSEPVTITGSPTIKLNTDPTRYATYVSGSGTSTPTFSYQVQDGDNVDALAKASDASSIALNGGSIGDGANDANLAINSVAFTPSIAVRAKDPTVQYVTIESNNATSGSAAKAGDVITITLAPDAIGGINTSLVTFTLTGFSPQPSLTFTATGTGLYTASFTLDSSATFNQGGVNYSMYLSDTQSSSSITSVNINASAFDNSSLASAFTIDTVTPTITSLSSLNITEGQTTGPAVTTNETTQYSIVGGADQSKVTINPNTGAISFGTAPDYANPDDANTDGIYEVIVQVNDMVGATVTQTIQITTQESSLWYRIYCRGGVSNRRRTRKLYWCAYFAAYRQCDHSDYFYR